MFWFFNRKIFKKKIWIKTTIEDYIGKNLNLKHGQSKNFFLEYYKNNYDDYSEFALHFCLSHK